jgi:transcriptional regulator with GAF, ATPase, and Fis domain/tetratricopeptide (TPR) repeat protein
MSRRIEANRAEWTQQPPRIAGYRPLHRLAERSGASTWLARSVDDSRDVVLKSAPPGDQTTLSQAFALLRATHCFSIPEPIEIACDAENRAWLVTAWVEGERMNLGPVDVGQVYSELRDLLQALDAIHQLGWHHGDLSLANIVLTPENVPILLDYGTCGQSGVGTPGFVAPEALDGVQGPKADIFALGCIVVSRLVGRLAFESVQDLLHFQGPTRAWLDRFFAGRSDAGEQGLEAWCEVLAGMLHPSPEKRWTAQQVRAALAQLDAAFDHAIARGHAHALHWRVPRHVPYCGSALADVFSALSDAQVRILAVVGPKHSGRHRLLRELAIDERFSRLEVIASGKVAWSTLAGHWLDIDGTQAIALHRQSLIANDAELVEGLLSVSELARGKLVLMCEREELGEVERSLGSVVKVIELQPLDLAATQDFISTWIDWVGEPSSRDREVASWACALFVATRGWPARLLQVARACQRNHVERRDQAWLTAVADLDAAMSQAEAFAVCAQAFGSGWSQESSTSAARTDDTMSLLAQAQAVLGQRVFLDLARQALRRCESEENASTALLLVLGGDEALGRRALALDSLGRNWPTALLAAIEASKSHADAVFAALIRTRLRAGEPLAVMQWMSERDLGFGEACCESLRAMQQVGRAKDVLEFLSVHQLEERWRWFGLALRWRSLIDLGRAAQVVAEHETIGSDLNASAMQESEVFGPVQALAWAGYAASLMLPPRLEEAHGCWRRALQRLGESSGWRYCALRARILQLTGNALLNGGEGAQALSAYRRAAQEFDAAAEEAGRSISEMNVCAAALLTGSIDLARSAGERALRTMIGNRQVQALVALTHNLVQVLLVGGEDHYAAAIVRAVRKVVPASDASALDRIRLAAMDLRCQLSHLSAIDRPKFEPATLAAIDDLLAELLVLQPSEARSLASEIIVWAKSRSLNQVVELAARVLASGDEGASGDDFECDWAIGSLVWRGADESTLERWDHVSAKWPILARLRYALARLRYSKVDRGPSLVVLRTLFDRVLSEVAPLRRPAVMRGLMQDFGEPRSLSLELMRELASEVMPSNGESSAKMTPTLGGQQASGSQRKEESLEPALAAENLVAPEKNARRKEPAQLERVLRWYRRVALESEVQGMVERMIDGLLELTQAERAFVVFRALGRELCTRREVQSGSSNFAVSTSVLDQVTSSGMAMLSVDAAADGRLDRSVSVSHLHLRSILAAPLMLAGQVVGVVYVDDRLRRGAFDSHDLAMLEVFAELCALALAHACALEDLRQRSIELELTQAQIAARLELSERAVAGFRENELLMAPTTGRYHELIGRSPPMVAVYRLVERLAASMVPVFISGESGTGKELVARALHESGSRASGPFVAENCGAIPETLLESVLFGHAKGAFTGADVARAGLFELAENGTIFLDELGEMSLAMQAKLLRVLQEGEVRRVGESRPRKLYARVIAASNCDLEEMVRKGTFRRDLYYRIHVVRIDLPPLRQRLGDIPQLVAHFLASHGAAHLRVRPSALRRLSTYAWPGNVRELENEVLRWAALCDGEVNEADLSPPIRGEVSPDAGEPTLLMRPQVDRLERTLIRRALETCNGNQSQASALLGLSRFGLQKKMKRLGEFGDAS